MAQRWRGRLDGGAGERAARRVAPWPRGGAGRWMVERGSGPPGGRARGGGSRGGRLARRRHGPAVAQAARWWSGGAARRAGGLGVGWGGVGSPGGAMAQQWRGPLDGGAGERPAVRAGPGWGFAGGSARQAAPWPSGGAGRWTAERGSGRLAGRLHGPATARAAGWWSGGAARRAGGPGVGWGVQLALAGRLHGPAAAQAAGWWSVSWRTKDEPPDRFSIIDHIVAYGSNAPKSSTISRLRTSVKYVLWLISNG